MDGNFSSFLFGESHMLGQLQEIPYVGYVYLAVVYTVLMNFYLSHNVMKARKKFDVKYPTMYSSDDRFNCYQRAHQNTLEYIPYVIILFVACAISWPLFASICQAIWVTSRFVYAHGYYTGDPQKRMRGVFGYIGFLGMLLYNLYVGLKLVIGF